MKSEELTEPQILCALSPVSACIKILPPTMAHFHHQNIDIEFIHLPTFTCSHFWCASLLAQLVKNPPAMRETWV